MRLFVAFDPSEAVRASLGAFIAKVKCFAATAALRIRWTQVVNLHITLKFIGEVSAERAAEIQTALAAATFPNPFILKVTGIGFFPNARRPEVIWAGIEPAEPLTRLAQTIELALAPQGLVRDIRPFSPHLTLARLQPRGKSLSDLGALVESLSGVAGAGFGRTALHDFHLYRSILKPAGAEYTRLATYPLGRGGEE